MNWHELPRVCAVRTIQQVAIFGSTSGVSTDTVATDPPQLSPELINDALNTICIGTAVMFSRCTEAIEW